MSTEDVILCMIDRTGGWGRGVDRGNWRLMDGSQEVDVGVESPSGGGKESLLLVCWETPRMEFLVT